MAAHGRVDATPWARQALPEQERAAIAERVPSGHVLWISTSNRREYTCRLTTPRGLVAQAFGSLPAAIEKVLA